MEQVQKKDLRHCPFCGGEATIREFATGCRGNGYPVFSTNGYDAAVELWNRRGSDAD